MRLSNFQCGLKEAKLQKAISRRSALDSLIVFELITAATKMRKVVSYTKFAILSSTIKN